MLPLWPFERAQPPGLERLESGLHLELVYPQAYPVIAPRLYPLQPEPELLARTDHRWHLNGDGSLCLLQSALGWRTEDGLTDLLLKAVGWRIEYALMHAGLLEAMTESGIVSDHTLDPLISYLPDAPTPLTGPGEASDTAPDGETHGSVGGGAGNPDGWGS